MRPILKRREGDLADDKEVEAIPEAASAQNADGVADADGEEGKWDGVSSMRSKYFMSECYMAAGSEVKIAGAMGPCPPATAAPVVTADTGAIPKRPLQGTAERQKDDPEEKTREDRETGASETGASEGQNAEVDNRGARDSHTDEVRQDKAKPPVEVKNDGPRDQERSKYTLK